VSRKLIILNIGGCEYIGEEPQKWPAEKGAEFTFRDVMLIEHQVVNTQQGPARAVFLHPIADYRLRGWYDYRPPLQKETNIYNQEKDASRMVKAPSVTPEQLEELRKKLPPEQFEALLKGMAGQPPAGGGIVTP
jgi:hypothetical protein